MLDMPSLLLATLFILYFGKQKYPKTPINSLWSTFIIKIAYRQGGHCGGKLSRDVHQFFGVQNLFANLCTSRVCNVLQTFSKCQNSKAQSLYHSVLLSLVHPATAVKQWLILSVSDNCCYATQCLPLCFVDHVSALFSSRPSYLNPVRYLIHSLSVIPRTVPVSGLCSSHSASSCLVPCS